MINETAILQLLFLLMVANGAPIIARTVFGSRYNYPIDANRVFFDGRPLLGPTKTFRGFVAAICATGMVAPWVGVSILTGALVGLCTMGGDLLSSFLKRRFGLRSSDSALGLDQSVETLCPALVLRQQFALHSTDILILVVAFFVLEIIASRILYWLRIRKRPL